MAARQAAVVQLSSFLSPLDIFFFQMKKIQTLMNVYDCLSILHLSHLSCDCIFLLSDFFVFRNCNFIFMMTLTSVLFQSHHNAALSYEQVEAGGERIGILQGMAKILKLNSIALASAGSFLSKLEISINFFQVNYLPFSFHLFCRLLIFPVYLIYMISIIFFDSSIQIFAVLLVFDVDFRLTWPDIFLGWSDWIINLNLSVDAVFPSVSIDSQVFFLFACRTLIWGRWGGFQDILVVVMVEKCSNRYMSNSDLTSWLF